MVPIPPLTIHRFSPNAQNCKGNSSYLCLPEMLWLPKILGSWCRILSDGTRCCLGPKVLYTGNGAAGGRGLACSWLAGLMMLRRRAGVERSIRGLWEVTVHVGIAGWWTSGGQLMNPSVPRAQGISFLLSSARQWEGPSSEIAISLSVQMTPLHPWCPRPHPCLSWVI